MDFIAKIKQKAKQHLKTIVLPEADDIRVLCAAEQIKKEGFAKIILLGNEGITVKLAKENNINLNDITIIDPILSYKKTIYINKLFELRKDKGLTLEKSKELIENNSMYFAAMMVKVGDADGYVAGANHATADTLKPALQIIKGRSGVKTVSAFFIIDEPDKEFGDNGLFIFSDCGMIENPDANMLSDIAISSAQSFKELVDDNVEAKIAMLSYSTFGSAHSELTEKVYNATKLAQEKAPNLLIDGEMQLDAAIIPEVATLKAPNSKVAGQANILIFPDLNSGNIGYKMIQRFGHAKAYGPLCQGLSKPVNDLSRGCSIEDIVGVVAITCVQAQDLK